MTKVPDRRKMRREYLWRKLAGYFGVTAATAGLMAAVAVALLFGVLAVFVLKNNYDDPSIFPLGTILAILLAIGACASVGAGVHGYRAAEGARKWTASLPHVPPVTASTLPPEEVLIRAADAPPVSQSALLLRAAQPGQGTPEQELLRVSQGE